MGGLAQLKTNDKDHVRLTSEMCLRSRFTQGTS